MRSVRRIIAVEIIVTNPIEARRARIAQFQVRVATFELAGQTVCGIVQSVVLDPAGTNPRWIVRLLPKPQSASSNRRYNPKMQKFVSTD